MTGKKVATAYYGILVLLSGLLTLAVATSHPWAAVDDAFITYRYADNLRHGLGFVYNVGESVLGTTAPLYGLLLGFIGLLPSSEIATIGFWLSGLAWVAGVWMAALFFADLGQPQTGLVAALLVATQPLMLTILGMETALVVFLMLASAWAWQQDRRVWAVICSAALILTRQDGALWVLLLGAEAWRQRRRLPWQETIATVVACAPWLVFAWWQYGNILPNSVLAKTGQVRRMEVSGVPSIWQRFWLYVSNGNETFYLWMFGSAVLIGILVILLRQRRLWWLPVWVILYMFIYHLLGVTSFLWYLLPPLVVVSLIAALGFGAFLTGASYNTSTMTKLRWLVVVVSLAGLSFSVVARGDRIMREHVRFDRADPHLHPYHAASLWLAEHTDPEAQVATIEIGAIGYHTPNPILDTMGLVSPQMMPFLTGWSDSLVAAVTQFWPAYAIVLPNTAWDGIVTQWWFEKHYRRVAQFSHVSIFQRQSRPVYRYKVETNAVYRTGLALREAAFESQTVEPGNVVDASLVFHVNAVQPANLQFTLTWIDEQTGERFGQETIWPFYLEGAWPANHWPAGATIPLPVRLHVPSELADGAYRLGLLVYNVAAGQAVPFADAPDVAFPEVRMGYFRVGDPPAASLPDDATELPMQARWQEGVTLRAIGLPDHPLRPGDVLPVWLNWQATGIPTRDATVFIHVVDANGKIVAQTDRRPFDGRFPLPVWRAGEVLTEVKLITLPPDLPGGVYSLRLGLYDATGRLPLIEDGLQERLQDDAALIGYIQVRP